MHTVRPRVCLNPLSVPSTAGGGGRAGPQTGWKVRRVRVPLMGLRSSGRNRRRCKCGRSMAGVNGAAKEIGKELGWRITTGDAEFILGGQGRPPWKWTFELSPA